MMVFPSIPIAIWFSVLYFYDTQAISTSGFYNLAMVMVGITFVVNSLDSLIRLYTDNLGLTVARLGKRNYLLGNIAVMVLLTLLFQLDFLEIQWVGALAIGLIFACAGYMLLTKLKTLGRIQGSPKENTIDFNKIELAD
ncbi:MAG: hypothetical protein Sw2LagPseu_18500 [Shewanella algae]